MLVSYHHRVLELLSLIILSTSIRSRLEFVNQVILCLFYYLSENVRSLDARQASWRNLLSLDHKRHDFSCHAYYLAVSDSLLYWNCSRSSNLISPKRP